MNMSQDLPTMRDFVGPIPLLIFPFLIHSLTSLSFYLSLSASPCTTFLELWALTVKVTSRGLSQKTSTVRWTHPGGMFSSTCHERPAVSAMSSAGISLSCGETRSPSPQPLPSSSRLPSYRSSYCGRYHPYGRKLPRKGQEIDLMVSIHARVLVNAGTAAHAHERYTFSAQKTIDMRYDNRASLSLVNADAFIFSVSFANASTVCRRRRGRV